jgi:hypothetical protein
MVKMIITNTMRLMVKNLVKNLYKDHGIFDVDKIEYAVDCILAELEIQAPRVFIIDKDEMKGCVTPVAELYSIKHEHVEQDGKKYLACSEDYICVFAAENYAALVTERMPVLRPNGWGDVEDVICGDRVYTRSTCREMDGIFDLLHA